MRVLWFTNVSFPDAGPEFEGDETGSGGWMWSLADALQRFAKIELCVVTAQRNGRDIVVKKNGIKYCRIAVPGKHFTRITKLAPDRAFVNQCKAVVSLFNPDLIHIHGTEQTYGLLTADRHINKPAVVSLQGVLQGILPHYFGTMRIVEIVKSHGLMNVLLRRGIVFDWMLFRKRCTVEADIIKGNRHIIGHTLWDKAHLRSINPNAIYYSYNEVLRSSFYREDIYKEKRARPTIIATYGGSPIRGTEIILRALAIVKRTLPNVELRLARGQFKRSRWTRDYATFIDSSIQQLGLSDCVTLLPPLSADEYASEMKQAHAFVLASLIENGSNTLLEAMILGTPCVVSYVGGTTSYINDEETVLCFPPGEHAVLAEQLLRLFRSQPLADSIGQRAQQVTRANHGVQSTVERIIEIYKAVINDV